MDVVAEPRRWVVACGGTGMHGFFAALCRWHCNAAVHQHNSNSNANNVNNGPSGMPSRVAFVVPVSDDGGSSREITAALGGGPAFGDLRNVTLRLADDSATAAAVAGVDTSDGARFDAATSAAVRSLLALRLRCDSREAAAAEFSALRCALATGDAAPTPVSPATPATPTTPTTPSGAQRRLPSLGAHRTAEAAVSLAALAAALPSDARSAVGDALTAFAAATAGGGGGRALDFRSASVGNAVLAGMWLRGGGLAAATAAFGALAGVPRWASVVPAHDCAAPQPPLQHPALPSSAMPTFVLSLVGHDGRVLLAGQRLISYGAVGGDHGSAEAATALCDDKARKAPPLDVGPIAAVRVAAGSAATTAHLLPLLQPTLSSVAGAPPVPPLLLLGRGSILTSMLASVAPIGTALAAEATPPFPRPLPAVLLLNGGWDRESAWLQRKQRRRAASSADGRRSCGRVTGRIARLVEATSGGAVRCEVAVFPERSPLAEPNDSGSDGGDEGNEAPALPLMCCPAMAAVATASDGPQCFRYDDDALVALLSRL